MLRRDDCDEEEAFEEPLQFQSAPFSPGRQVHSSVPEHRERRGTSRRPPLRTD